MWNWFPTIHEMIPTSIKIIIDTFMTTNILKFLLCKALFQLLRLSTEILKQIWGFRKKWKFSVPSRQPLWSDGCHIMESAFYEWNTWLLHFRIGAWGKLLTIRLKGSHRDLYLDYPSVMQLYHYGSNFLWAQVKAWPSGPRNAPLHSIIKKHAFVLFDSCFDLVFEVKNKTF